MAPKRKRDPKEHGKKPVKRSKYNEQSDDDDSGEETTAQLERKNEGRYEVAVGDTISPKLGVEDISKLRLQFRRIDSGLVGKQHTSEKIPSNKIEWNDKKHIIEIQKWRRQHLRRHGFPLERKVTSWLPREEAFLKLLFRRLDERTRNGEQIRKPTTKQIMEHFNSFFSDENIKKGNDRTLLHYSKREENSIGSKLKQDTELGRLAIKVKDNLTADKNMPVSLPSITEKELDRFMKDGKTGTDTTEGDEVKSLSEGQRSGITGEPSVTTGHMGVAATAESPVGGSSDSVRNFAGTYKQISAETAVETILDHELERMISDGWFIPHISEDAKIVGLEDETNTLEDTWIYKAVEGFEARWRNMPFGFEEGHRMDWYIDPKTRSKGKSRKGRTNLPGEQRKTIAQSVNGLLSHAVCPPLRYGGDINALTDNKLLSKSELALAKQNKSILAVHQQKTKAKLGSFKNSNKVK